MFNGAGESDRLGGRVYVGVIEDQERCLASELEVDTFEILPSGARHLASGPDRTGERHEGGRRMRHDGSSCVPVTAHHVQNARRQVLGGELSEQER